MAFAFRQRFSSWSRKLLENAPQFLFLVLFLVVCAARLWTWLGPAITGHPKEPELQIAEAVPTNPRHEKISRILVHVWAVAQSSEAPPKLLIAKSREINAASFGNGRFLFWDGTADLPDDILEAIVAHEVAHDLLNHARDSEELQDLTNFFGDVVGFVTGSDDSTEKTLKHWFGNVVLPKYSRTQELEADARAMELLRLSGNKNPRETMAACLEMLLNKYGNSGGKFFDSHPSTRERIDKLNTR